jgi:sugar phosphate isomerase/epimerase
MYYTGFADEAGASIDVQIQATKELGWSHIESRNIDGINLTDISDEKFEEVSQKLTDAGIQINCFGSTVANWGKDPRKEEDFQRSIAELQRAIPRMQKLGTKMIRGMSFAVAKNEEPDNQELEQIVFDKVQHLVKMCEDGGVIYVHENCMNYGGMSHEHTLKLIENINSPNFKLVFDTGNPVSTDRRIGVKPYPKQSAWEFYSNVREFIYYVHIKDGIYIGETESIFADAKYTFPGEGDGEVEKIVRDLLKTGYDGGFSMEPHLSVVFHDASVQTSADIMYNNYLEYGKRFMKIVEKVQGG